VPYTQKYSAHPIYTPQGLWFVNNGLLIEDNAFKYPEEVLAMTRPFVSILIIFLVEGAAYAKG
jgi:hypothetical protein